MTQVFKNGAGSESVDEVNATANDEIVLLPANFSPGRKFTVRRVDSGTSGHSVTVTVATGQTLDGVVNGSRAVAGNVEGWLSPTDPGIWESYGFTSGSGGGGGTTVSADGSGNLTIGGTVYPLTTDAELAAALAAQAATLGPAAGSDNWLKAWGSNIDALIRATTITRDSSEAATGANVVWPDATAGVYAGTASVSPPGAIDSYTVTYLGATTKTVTQPTMTRDAAGAVTNRPAMTVS